MALKLKIVSDNAERLGQRAHIVLGVNGGRIGRSADNDWILPDPERYVSGHHAEVEHVGGEWRLLDHSTNGTFINGARRPLGPGGSHVLRNGDIVRIGAYDIEVFITGGNDFPPDQPPLLTDTALDARVDVRSLLDDTGSPGIRASDAYGQEVVVPTSRSRAREAAEPTRGPPRGGPLGDERDLWPGIVALCKGAGIDPYTLPAEMRASMLQQAGQALREIVLGFLELSRTRAEFSHEFGVAPPSKVRDGTSPLVRASGVDESMRRLLSPRGGSGALGPGAVEALRLSFAEVRAHELAVTAAMREALAELLDRLDPDAIAGARNAVGADVEAKQWSRYRGLFRALVQAGEGGMPQAFAEEFARAYRTLANASELPGDTDDTNNRRR